MNLFLEEANKKALKEYLKYRREKEKKEQVRKIKAYMEDDLDEEEEDFQYKY
jgi:hypothetical protein